MPHSITNKPSGVVLTANIPDFVLGVDGYSILVRLTAQNGNTLLQERYYTEDVSLTIYDLRSLIENYMRAKALTYGDFTLAVVNDNNVVADSCVIHALYCDRCNVCAEPEVFLAENFLTTLSHRRVAPDSWLRIYYYSMAGVPSSVHVKCLYNISYMGDEVFATSYDVQNATTTGLRSYSTSPYNIITKINQMHGTPREDIRLISFTVSLGQRSLTCYVDYSLRDADCFAFRNCFNVLEKALFPHTTTAKTDVEHATAVINNVSQQYNRHVTKSYEVQSAALTYDEAMWIDQLLTSHDISRHLPDDTDENNVSAPVLITEATCEVSDSDNSPNTVKFTWRFADNRPNVRLSCSPGIFTSPYNTVFS